jgi:mitogen-activated protein kinase kinase 4
MAPERIHPKQASRGYDIRSDVWSLGITLMELAMGQFPYPTWNSVFDQLTCVLRGEAPRLSEEDTRFSDNFRHFVHDCLNKEVEKRPKYSQLKEHPFFVESKADDVNVGEYFTQVLNAVPNGQELYDFLAKDC